MNPAPSTFIRDGTPSERQITSVVTFNLKDDNVNQWGNLGLQKHPSKAMPSLNGGPGGVPLSVGSFILAGQS